MKQFLLFLMCVNICSAMPLFVDGQAKDKVTGLAYFQLSIDLSQNNRSHVLDTYLWKNQITSSRTPVHSGLGPFMTVFENKNAVAPNANCFNSAIATITTSYWPERFMSTEEMICTLRNYAKEVSNWSFGDIAVIYQAGRPIHAMTYLGWDKNDPQTHYVFSKLGHSISTKYLVTTLRDIFGLYKSHEIHFFRLNELFVPDAATSHEQSNCYYEYKNFSATFGQSEIPYY